MNKFSGFIDYEITNGDLDADARDGWVLMMSHLAEHVEC